MVDHEITTIAAAIDEASKKLAAARAGNAIVEIEKIERTISVQAGSLFSRYVDVVLWSDGFDKAMYLTTRGALKKGCDAVSWRATDDAASVKGRLDEFEKFSDKHRHHKRSMPVSRER
jgi:hypothetical protein